MDFLPLATFVIFLEAFRVALHEEIRVARHRSCGHLGVGDLPGSLPHVDLRNLEHLPKRGQDGLLQLLPGFEYPIARKQEHADCRSEMDLLVGAMGRGEDPFGGV